MGRYALITFDSVQGQVREIKGIIPAKGLNYFLEENWEKYLSPNYPDSSEESQESEASEDIILLELKPRLERKKKHQEIQKYE